MFLLIKSYSFDMELNLAVAETLKCLRKEHKVSQEKLADAIDSHQVYISEIEKGKKIPSLTILYNIAKFYKMNLSELAKLIEEKSP